MRSCGLWCTILLLCLCSCAGQKCDTATDTGMKYAKLLTIIPEEGYTRVEVRSKEGNKTPTTYLLIPEGAEKPHVAGEVIHVPVKSLVVNSTVYAYPLKELGKIDVVKGVTDAAYFTMPEIQQGLKQGTVIDAGNSQSPTVEKIVDLNPDGILINLYEGMNMGSLPTAGVPYIKFADNMEPTALGRAEWIKFLGLLTGREAEADSIFSEVEKEYKNLQNLASTSKSRPKVLVENMYEGVWYVPGGGSVAGTMLSDAGALYPWASNTDSGSLALSYEEVFSKAEDADIWLLKVYGMTPDKTTLRKMDERYSQFQPFKTGKIWYSDTSISGLYDIIAFHPEKILKEQIAIFHPELLPDYQLNYYQQIATDK